MQVSTSGFSKSCLQFQIVQCWQHNSIKHETSNEPEMAGARYRYRGVKTLDLSVKTLSSQINKHSLVPHVHTGHHKRLFHDTIGQSEACIPAINQSEAML